MITSMKDAFSLKGKTAIVTGGARGLGKGISLALAEQGANIAIFCRGMKAAEETVKELTAIGGTHRAYRTDVTDFANCKESVEQAIKDFGRIDILVNNSGVAWVGDILDMDEDLAGWYQVMNVDLNGAFTMSYLVGKHMREMGGGRVINISSNSGEMVNKPQKMAPYNVAKAGLNRLTKCLAYEWAPYHIQVNAIAPGYTDSDLTNLMTPEEQREVHAKIPAGRFGNPAEIGALAVYLASPASEQMTGAVLTIDGGYSLAI